MCVSQLVFSCMLNGYAVCARPFGELFWPLAVPRSPQRLQSLLFSNLSSEQKKQVPAEAALPCFAFEVIFMIQACLKGLQRCYILYSPLSANFLVFACTCPGCTAPLAANNNPRCFIAEEGCYIFQTYLVSTIMQRDSEGTCANMHTVRLYLRRECV